MEYINIEDIKENDYIVAEIGDWSDDDDNNFTNGICYGHIKEFIQDKWDDEYEIYYDAFECYEAIYADGSTEVNGELGAVDNTKYRYMTEDEIIDFKKNFE